MSEVKGIIVAPPTPFTNSGEVDEEGLRDLIRYLVESRVHGFMAAGVTAEFASLSITEYEKVISINVDEVNGKVPVIANTGLCDTRGTIMMSKYAENVGADAVIAMSPYFWLPTKEGIYEHFKDLSEAIDIPIFIFNNPHRTGTVLDPAFLAELAKIDGVVGVKSAITDIAHFSELIRLVDPKFSVFAGYDTTLLPVLAVGGKGVFSVVANIAPRTLIDLFNAFESGDLRLARELQFKIVPIAKALFKGYPASIKVAFEMLGMAGGPVRKPLTSLKEDEKRQLAEVLKQFHGDLNKNAR